MRLSIHHFAVACFVVAVLTAAAFFWPWSQHATLPSEPVFFTLIVFAIAGGALSLFMLAQLDAFPAASQFWEDARGKFSIWTFGFYMSWGVHLLLLLAPPEGGIAASVTASVAFAFACFAAIGAAGVLAFHAYRHLPFGPARRSKRRAAT